MAGYRKLGRPTDQRRAMLRSLVTRLLSIALLWSVGRPNLR